MQEIIRGAQFSIGAILGVLVFVMGILLLGKLMRSALIMRRFFRWKRRQNGN